MDTTSGRNRVKRDGPGHSNTWTGLQVPHTKPLAATVTGSVDAPGCSVDAPGCSVDAPGCSVDATGCSVDAPGCSIDASTPGVVAWQR
jgi:hypothetical protein